MNHPFTILITTINKILNLITKIRITFLNSFQGISITARYPRQFPMFYRWWVSVICQKTKCNTFLTTLQNDFLWLKLSLLGKELLETVTSKVWSTQADMQVFSLPPSIMVRNCPKIMVILPVICIFNYWPRSERTSLKHDIDSPWQLLFEGLRYPG